MDLLKSCSRLSKWKTVSKVQIQDKSLEASVVRGLKSDGKHQNVHAWKCSRWVCPGFPLAFVCTPRAQIQQCFMSSQPFAL